MASLEKIKALWEKLFRVEQQSRSLGQRGEDEAVRFLKKKGYRVKARNVRFGRLGELDIIAEKDGCLVFVEVKARKSRQFGRPEEALTEQKKRHLLNMVKAYLHRFPQSYNQVRIDLLALQWEGCRWQVNHLENAITDG